MYIWQTKKWGEMLISSNQAKKIFNIDGIQIEKRKIALKKYGLFIIGIEQNFLNSIINEKQQILESLKNLCKKEKCIFIQIEIINYKGIENTSQSQLDKEKNKSNGFKKGYYKKFITPYTAIIDLNKKEEEILSEMKAKGRYNIKLAEKKGILVKDVEKNKQNIKEFYNLMLETTGRNGFAGNKLDYYNKFLKQIEDSKLLLAYFEDKVIAAGIFIFEKKVSIYYYGASTSDIKYRNLMAPFLLQWEAIKIAKNYPSKIYDFLGIATPGNIKSSLSGITDFKMKLTPNNINISNSYIYINNKIIYLIIKLLKKFK